MSKLECLEMRKCIIFYMYFKCRLIQFAYICNGVVCKALHFQVFKTLLLKIILKLGNYAANDKFFWSIENALLAITVLKEMRLLW